MLPLTDLVKIIFGNLLLKILLIFQITSIYLQKLKILEMQF